MKRRVSVMLAVFLLTGPVRAQVTTLDHGGGGDHEHECEHKPCNVPAPELGAGLAGTAAAIGMIVMIRNWRRRKF
jgi:hypothetical protein